MPLIILSKAIKEKIDIVNKFEKKIRNVLDIPY